MQSEEEKTMSTLENNKGIFAIEQPNIWTQAIPKSNFSFHMKIRDLFI
jgi:hypothetical protein